MRQKLIQTFLCIALLLMTGYIPANGTEELSHRSLTVEKTFKKEGLRFQVTLTDITEEVEKPPLFQVNTTVTNLTKKTIPYVQFTCENVRSSIKVKIADETYFLLPPGDQACTPTTHQKELRAGSSISQEELFTTAFLPIDLDDEDLYVLESSLHIGREEEQGRNVSFVTHFDKGISLPIESIDIEAKLTKASSKFQLDVKGTAGNKEIKYLYLKAGKTKYLLRINKKTRAFFFSKKITIKGNPPDMGVLEISYADGTKQTLDIPIKLSPEK